MKKLDLESVMSTYFELCELKNVFRAGWLESGIAKEHCESVGDHTFGVALLAFLLADRCDISIDANKVIKMCLLHDIAEVYVGDITPSQNMGREEKYCLEKEAVEKIFSPLGLAKREYLNLWEEFESKKTVEAIFASEIDQLEMALQAIHYFNKKMIDREKLKEFLSSAKKKIKRPFLMEMLESFLNLDS